MNTEIVIFQSSVVVVVWVMVMMGWYSPNGKHLHTITERENPCCPFEIVDVVGNG